MSDPLLNDLWTPLCRAGDLMMATVLRILNHTDIVSSDKRLAAYVERCTARPAFKRALDAQIGDFKKAA
jgi:glutathione S-transferase